MTENPLDTAYQRCLQLLTRREHSLLELRQKLSQQHIDADVIETCLSRLIEENYQSDQRFAEMLCRTRISQRHGRQKIRYELKQKGINDTLAKTTLNEHEDVWVENAKHLIERKAPRGDLTKVFSDFTLKNKITRFLVGKGYDYDTISLAFEILQCEDE